MRAKETSDDYRYFPEPDLPPLHVDAAWIDGVRADLPELPAARRARYMALGLGAYDAAVIVADPDASRIFDALRAGYPDQPSKTAANWITGEYLRLKRKYPAEDAVFVENPAGLGDIIKLVIAEAITPANAKEVFEQHFAHGMAVDMIVRDRGLTRISDDGSLLGHIDAVIAANPRAVADYRAGKPVVGFFVGQVMKATGGAADAARVTTLVLERLDRGG
jgi:aspartyl-tRNA(Asn)/glutamyl-tRNA(Gln) amidotransferase subunit B